MSNVYTVLSAPVDNVANPMCCVAIFGKVNSIYVLIAVYKSALDQAAAGAGIAAYLGPLMLFASTALYQQTGPNPTINSTTAIPFNAAATQYVGIPATWTA
jgi:hypothetical protein